MARRNYDESELPQCTELIVVCCHGTYTGTVNGTEDALSEPQWTLQDFQRADPRGHRSSEIATFASHIIAGALACHASPKAMLMFSGGRTTSSDRSEAESYAKVLPSLVPRPILQAVLPRMAVEDQATDSHQNLLFSILRFHTLTGRYPSYVTVITHAFKVRRFLEIHGGAIRWPAERLRVQGINPPFTIAEQRETEHLEYEKAYKLFEADPYGMRPPLATKRIARNWRPQAAEGLSKDAVVKRLLAWESGESGSEKFPEELPWSTTKFLDTE
ncbi:hypothetical protein LTR62_001528 [Meristemomyces frigidus]|uniref:DUF218 domain-containing protein n=1 Tax=Meristemomyces frigidus TaxID=1508187 RepID=A0AAN7YLR3_9PEZI|nr:hypothetical protein LTR62_001528 [Meristemomyces frigidus]